jgi:hypothetical protein
MSLPRTSIRYYVLSIMQSLRLQKKNFLPTTRYLLPTTNPQRGFALLPLIVLLLVGIATGTLLIQNGVNFLPKAALRPCTSAETEACTKEGATCVAEGDNFLCRDAYNYSCGMRISDRVPAIGLGSSTSTGFEVKTVCPNGCEMNPITQSYACKSTQTTPCSLSGFKGVTGEVIDQLPYGTHLTGCDSAGNLVNYACLGENNGLVPTILEGKSPKCTQPAPVFCTLRNVRRSGETYRNDVNIQSGQSQKFCDVFDKKFEYSCDPNGKVIPKAIPSEDKECSASTAAAPKDQLDCSKEPSGTKYITNCSNPKSIKYSVCNSSGFPVDFDWDKGIETLCDGKLKCLNPEVCNSSAQGAPAPAAGSGEVAPEKCPTDRTGDEFCADPKQKKLYGFEADSKDEIAGKCYKISGKARCPYAPNYQSPDSANGPCNEDDNRACGKGNCELVTVTLSTTKKKIQYSQCKTSQSSSSQASSTGAGAATGAQTPGTRPQTAAGTGSLVRPDMVNAECGYDKDGTRIPCYKVGVFASDDEVKATQTWAGIAAKRYEQSQEILTKVRDSINKEVAAAAQKKLEAAKAAADACMKQ